MDRYQKPRYKHDYHKNYNLGMLFRRYKKALIVGGAAMAVFLTAATVGFGYLAYKAVTVSADQIGDLKQSAAKLVENKNLENLVAPDLGLVGGVVTGVAKTWLMQNIQSSEVSQIQSALSCLNAFGAPSPTDMMQVIKRSVSDNQWSAKLETLESQLKSFKGPQGAEACTHWFMNS